MVWQNYNNELVKCIEDLKEKREEVNRQILQDEVPSCPSPTSLPAALRFTLWPASFHIDMHVSVTSAGNSPYNRMQARSGSRRLAIKVALGNRFQGYLAHEKASNPPRPPWGPRHKGLR